MVTRHGWLLTLAATLLTGCGEEPILPRAEADIPAPVAEPPAARGADFSTPSKAVETLIAAAEAGDAQAVSQCFAPNADDEFKKLYGNAATNEQFHEFAQFVGGASVVGQRIAINGSTALVSVTFKVRDQEVRLTSTEDGWKVVGF